MKLRLAIFATLLVAFGVAPSPAMAQPSVTRRTPQSPGPRGYFLPTNSVPLKSPAPVTPSSIVDTKAARTPVVVVVPPPAPPLTQDEKDKRETRKLEFQRTQAEAGRDFAQYEMGLRHLKGDGVPQDEAEARKWLKLAADQNYTLAIRKLAELDAPPAPPKKKK